jgi:hypothetical protein
MRLAYESQRESALDKTRRRASGLSNGGLEYCDLDEDLAEGEFDGIEEDIGGSR